MYAVLRSLILCLMFLAAPVFAVAQPSVTFSTHALYHFDEAVGDSVHDAGPGRFHGVADGPTVVPGIWGNARRFGGTRDRVSVPAYNPSGPFSIEAFVNLDPPAGGEQMHPLVGHGVYVSSLRGYLLWVITTSDGLSSVVFWANSKTGDTTVFLADTRNASPPRYFAGFESWHHIAGVWNGKTAQVYVDGELWHEVVGDSTAPIGANSAATFIGSDTLPTGLESLRGSIDEVRFSRISSHRDTMDVTPSWNLLSVPVVAQYAPVDLVFPGATSEAFSYTGTYAEQRFVSNGTGYWLKFPAAMVLGIAGDSLTGDTVEVRAGWNVIGSLTVPLPVSAVTQDPPAIIASHFYRFSPTEGYVRADTLQPGSGYWVKTRAPGELILHASGGAGSGSRASHESRR